MTKKTKQPAVGGAPSQGHLLEFVPGAGTLHNAQPVAVFMGMEGPSMRRRALEVIAPHWRYMFAREDFGTRTGWIIHDKFTAIFPDKGPRDHYYRLVPIKVFI